MTDNEKAVVVYVDDTPRCLEEFSWLYKSWALWGLDAEFDIVAYHNPTASNKLPDHPNLIKRPQAPLRQSNPFWDEYRFVNSFAMFHPDGEKEWIEENYTHIMKTDCDVFLTKHLMGRKPVRFLLGLGGQLDERANEQNEKTIQKIQETTKKLGLRSDHINHVGASIFGPAGPVVSVINLQLEITECLLRNEWQDDPGEWPGWFKGVASMYAVQIAVNSVLHRQFVIPYVLDAKCWKTTQIGLQATTWKT
jgi:hypothetical protein